MSDKSTGVIAPTKIPDEPSMNIIGSVQSLHVDSPNDVIILSLDMIISKDETERVIEMWKRASGLPNRVVCLIKGVDVSVIRPGERK